jgi:phosphoribosyl 1,2-cyclic phosphodiesterase
MAPGEAEDEAPRGIGSTTVLLRSTGGFGAVTLKSGSSTVTGGGVGLSDCPSAVTCPHCPQKRDPSAREWPHLGQGLEAIALTIVRERRMRVWLLSSGSTGNAAVIEGQSGARLLVDAGIGPRSCATRMRRLGTDMFPRGVVGIVITHHHGDHIAHLEPLVRALRVPVYLHDGIAASRVRARYDVRVYPRRGLFTIGPFKVRAEPVPHDAPQVALSIAAGGVRFGIATDLGHVQPHLVDLLSECDEALVEANYCEELLREGSYPPRLKIRVGGDLGHLSNHQTAALVRQLAKTRVRRLWLGHISQSNNTPKRALDCIRPHARDLEVEALEHGIPRLLELKRSTRAMTQLGFGFQP